MKRFTLVLLSVALAGCATFGGAVKPATSIDPEAQAWIDAIASFEKTASANLPVEGFAVIGAIADDPAQLAAAEDKLCAVLKAQGTDILAKQAICDVLGVYGTERSVPTLAGMLEKKCCADAAHLALERIPGKAAKAALK